MRRLNNETIALHHAGMRCARELHEIGPIGINAGECVRFWIGQGMWFRRFRYWNAGSVGGVGDDTMTTFTREPLYDPDTGQKAGHAIQVSPEYQAFLEGAGE